MLNVELLFTDRNNKDEKLAMGKSRVQFDLTKDARFNSKFGEMTLK